VRQYADICLFSTAQYKCSVAELESEWVNIFFFIIHTYIYIYIFIYIYISDLSVFCWHCLWSIAHNVSEASMKSLFANCNALLNCRFTVAERVATKLEVHGTASTIFLRFIFSNLYRLQQRGLYDITEFTVTCNVVLWRQNGPYLIMWTRYNLYCTSLLTV